MTRPILATAILLTLAFASTTDATPITYSESLSLDLSGQSIGVLDAGVNTVTGTSTVLRGATIVTDLDPFEFTIPTGHTVTGARFDWTLTSVAPSTGGLYSAVIDYALASSTISSTVTVDLCLSPTCANPAGSVLPFSAAFPLVADTYALSVPGWGLSGLGSSGADLGWIANYTWTFTVASSSTPTPVPEPATLLLLAAGLGTTGLSRRLRYPA